MKLSNLASVNLTNDKKKKKKKFNVIQLKFFRKLSDQVTE